MVLFVCCRGQSALKWSPKCVHASVLKFLFSFSSPKEEGKKKKKKPLKCANGVVLSDFLFSYLSWKETRTEIGFRKWIYSYVWIPCNVYCVYCNWKQGFMIIKLKTITMLFDFHKRLSLDFYYYVAFLLVLSCFSLKALRV